jgi:hypothetical protein
MTNRTDQDSKKPQLFLSYSSQDVELARAFSKALDAKGISVWDVAHSVRVGESVIGEIADAMRKSDAIAFLLSKKATDSSWVSREIGLAIADTKHQAKRIIPLLTSGDVEVPPFLRDLRYIDLSQMSVDVAAQSVADATRSLVSETPWSEKQLRLKQEGLEAEYANLQARYEDMMEAARERSASFMMRFGVATTAIGVLTAVGMLTRSLKETGIGVFVLGVSLGAATTSTVLARSSRARKFVELLAWNRLLDRFRRKSR